MHCHEDNGNSSQEWLPATDTTLTLFLHIEFLFDLVMSHRLMKVNYLVYCQIHISIYNIDVIKYPSNQITTWPNGPMARRLTTITVVCNQEIPGSTPG